eukprot:CAMPEP_0183741386 /NCGR_PEP_ID=MMETSP0737-20130205/62008_1 /TAXON_ID=385413 /ORGANISM="Thalassiosira miniscula, Strain CCMP1093" /LENGTH=105 /DNA_ID=CAMNT_0025976703 /DNA_START=301 /DNA_END=615 /DNA_ORIENTATION=+
MSGKNFWMPGKMLDDGAEQDCTNDLIRVDYHVLRVNEMRSNFKEHLLPILPVVEKVMIITGRGLHSTGKEAKLKEALFKLVNQYSSNVYLQESNKYPGSLYCCGG